jgi:hypothetical protein
VTSDQVESASKAMFVTEDDWRSIALGEGELSFLYKQLRRLQHEFAGGTPASTRPRSRIRPGLANCFASPRRKRALNSELTAEVAVWDAAWALA